MKKVLLIFLILIRVNSLFSQINKEDIAFELRYPVPIGHNFLNKGFGVGYLGLIDIGVDYNLLKIDNFGIGFLLNSSVLKSSLNDVSLVTISPKINIDFKIRLKKISIIPNIGAGYSCWFFAVHEGEEKKESFNGLTLNAGVKLALNSDRPLKFFLLFAYEFTKLEKPKPGVLDISYNRNMQILYPGIGVIWKFI